MIDSYAFGRIIIGGATYTSDLIIYPDGRIEDSWLRKKGHRLSAEDIADLIDSKPEVIIAGTGAYGIMRPSGDLAAQLDARGVEFKAMTSAKAVNEYNELAGTKRVGACFHLTC